MNKGNKNLKYKFESRGEIDNINLFRVINTTLYKDSNPTESLFINKFIFLVVFFLFLEFFLLEI